MPEDILQDDCFCTSEQLVSRLDFEEAKCRILEFFRSDPNSSLVVREDMVVPSSTIARHMERYRRRAAIARALVRLLEEGKLERVEGTQRGQTAKWRLSERGKQCLGCPYRQFPA